MVAKHRFSRALTLILVICGLVFMFYGVIMGENAEMAEKGSQVCLSCIGIG